MQRLKTKLVIVFALALIVGTGIVGHAAAQAPEITPHHQSMAIKSNLVEPRSFRLHRLQDTERKEVEARQAESLRVQAEQQAQQDAAKAEQDRIQASQVTQPVEQPAVQETPVAVVVETPSACGDNQYANYIYMHESTCNTNAMNSSGCYGIGQACPASKVTQCGTDYSCQNAWFTNYANTRYGGWAGAYAFWLNNHWW